MDWYIVQICKSKAFGYLSKSVIDYVDKLSYLEKRRCLEDLKVLHSYVLKALKTIRSR